MRAAHPAGLDLTFLGRLGHALVESLDSRETLQRMADLAVPGLADWCAIDRVCEDGSFERMAVAHSDPSKVQIAHDLWKFYPPSPDDPQGLAQVVRSGQPELLAELSDEMLVAGARDERQLAMLRALGLRSFVIVPLAARRRVLGALSLVQAESSRRFSAEQIPALGEFAQLAALALDNALLFEQTRRSLDQALALAEATRQQCEETVAALVAMRRDKERALQRVAELEALLASREGRY